jgi:hypothetical protein
LRCAASEAFTMMVFFNEGGDGMWHVICRGGVVEAVTRMRGGVGGVTRMGGSMRDSAAKRLGRGRRMVGVDEYVSEYARRCATMRGRLGSACVYPCPP